MRDIVRGIAVASTPGVRDIVRGTAVVSTNGIPVRDVVRGVASMIGIPVRDVVRGVASTIGNAPGGVRDIVRDGTTRESISTVPDGGRGTVYSPVRGLNDTDISAEIGRVRGVSDSICSTMHSRDAISA